MSSRCYWESRCSCLFSFKSFNMMWQQTCATQISVWFSLTSNSFTVAYCRYGGQTSSTGMGQQRSTIIKEPTTLREHNVAYFGTFIWIYVQRVYRGVHKIGSPKVPMAISQVCAGPTTPSWSRRPRPTQPVTVKASQIDWEVSRFDPKDCLFSGAYFGLERAGHRPKALHRGAQGRPGVDYPHAAGQPWDGDGKVVRFFAYFPWPWTKAMLFTCTMSSYIGIREKY